MKRTLLLGVTAGLYEHVLSVTSHSVRPRTRRHCGYYRFAIDSGMSCAAILCRPCFAAPVRHWYAAEQTTFSATYYLSQGRFGFHVYSFISTMPCASRHQPNRLTSFPCGMVDVIRPCSHSPCRLPHNLSQGENTTLIDARSLPHGLVLSTDICIVGAGTAGISLALEFVGTGINVLLLESGGTKADNKSQKLYAGSVTTPHLHSPPDRYRQRRFGGSSTIWGGRCVPFDDIDFQTRSYIPNSGWPFNRDTLLPYYHRASRLCETGRFAHTSQEVFPGNLRPMIDGFRSSNFTSDTLERFSAPTNFGIRYGDELRAAPNIHVLLHANLTALHLNAEGTSVTSATVKTLTGIALKVTANAFVLATGGLEVARLLLASNDVQRAGIGNNHDLVGRYYMCHIAGTLGSLTLALPDTVRHDYEVSDDGVYCRRRLALTGSAQHRLKIGNFIARLHHPRITDPSHRTGSLSFLYLAKAFIPYESGKRLHGEEPASVKKWLQHATNVLFDFTGTIFFLIHWFCRHTLARRKFPSIIVKSKSQRYSIDFHAEQQPNSDSRVTLGNDRDALGMLRLNVDWRYTDADVDTVRSAIALLAADLHNSGVGTLDYDPSALEAEITRYGAYGGHHIGTARMGNDPRSSVVDPNGRIHNVDNLFVASSAVFPTSSQANPTLTIVAMALKLADHLKTLHCRPPAFLTGQEVPLKEVGRVKKKHTVGAA